MDNPLPQSLQALRVRVVIERGAAYADAAPARSPLHQLESVCLETGC
ncbi:MAG: hypothetical protein F6K28_29675 [Microcoleus sp. SIO2G3]|nr:hypothetical protein [Microcoleus sp. SIO2G3]